MALSKFNPQDLLRAAIRFEQLVKQAQGTYQYDPDKMKRDLDASIGKKVSDLAAKYLGSSAISSVQININYTGPGVANFTVMATGSDADKVNAAMAANLNALAPTAGRIMAKYQKDKPIDYKYANFE